MWLSVATISQRGVRYFAKMLRTQNKEELYKSAWDLPTMSKYVRQAGGNKTATSNQNSRGESLLEIDKVKKHRILTPTEIEKISEKIEQKKKDIQDLQELLDFHNKSKSEQKDVERWTSSEFPWSSALQEKLLKVFGFDNLNVVQQKAINATMYGKDVLVMMATGGGKSLCYQLPAIMSEGITLVISPLVSLMEDQVMELKKLGIPAEMLTSSTPTESILEVYQSMENKPSKLKLLYISPEKLSKNMKFLSKLDQCYKMGNLSRIAIDEMHCIDDWGNNFRPDYKILRILKEQFPLAPIIGLSASSTPECLEEIKRVLQIPNALVFKSSLNRNNLFYEVRTKPPTHQAVVHDMASTINNNFPGESGIVYCRTRRNCSDVSAGLTKHGIPCAFYHSNLSHEEKKDIHTKWLSGEVQVICATIAFGMGINKANVRFVIHHSITKSLETYYQESGRAGRDGLPAVCILYFGFNDISRLNGMVLKESSGLRKLSKVVRYCLNTTRCRHEMLIEPMDRNATSCCGSCDLCNSMYESKFVDVTDISRSLMEIVKSAYAVGRRLTGNQLIKRLHNSKKQGLSVLEIQRLILYFVSCDYFRQEYQFCCYRIITHIVPGRKASIVNWKDFTLDFPVPVSNREMAYKRVIKRFNSSLQN